MVGRTGYGCGLKGNGVLWGLGLVSLGGAMLRYALVCVTRRHEATLIFLRLCEFQYESKPFFSLLFSVTVCCNISSDRR